MPFEICIVDEGGRELARYQRERATAFQPGDSLVLGSERLTIAHVEHALTVESHVVRIYTTRFPAATASGEQSNRYLADFVRYHALVRVFDGDANAWLQLLAGRQETNSADARFARWIRRAMETDPAVLQDLRQLVDGSGLWPAA